MTITNGAVAVNGAKHKDWLTWFHSRKSATIINQSQQEQFFKTFDATVSEDETITKVEDHEETTFLYKVNFGQNRVELFHHMKASGGTLYDSGVKEYGFIQGVEEGHPAIMTPDIAVLSKVESDSDTAVPTTTNLLNVKTKAEVEALTVSATVKYRARNIIPVPPFLLEPVQKAISSNSGDAKMVLVAAAEEIKAFDSKHADDAAYVDKAKTKCKEFLYWLYIVSSNHDAVKAVNTIVCTNAKVKEYLIRTTVQHISEEKEEVSSIANQLEASLKRPFEVLAATSSSTPDFMEKLTQLQNQTNEKSSRTFKKIPAKYQQMILVAASSSEVTEVDYNAEAVEFFKCSSPLHAQVMLNSILEAEGIECSVSSAMATTLLYGSFLWRNPIAPAGLASSVLTSEGIIRSDTLQDGMVLDFATKFEMSAISLSKLTKTQVLFPKDVEELTHRMRGIQRLAAFFFKKHGFMSQGLKKIVNFCLDNRRLLKTKIYMDPRFIAKFMCAVDERIYLWLKDYSICQAVTDTNLSLMNYATITQDIILNRFIYHLPPTIASLVEKDEEKPTGQRSESRKKEDMEVHRNNERVEEWKMRKGESWNNVFCNKAIEGPMLTAKCHPCLKYHVRGSCYADCKNKASHCILHGDDKVKTANFIKSLRGE